MRMPDCDKEKIIEKGKFFEERGYVVETDDFSVKFIKDNIKFMAYYERYEESSSFDIKFIEGNKHFSIGWIWFVRNGEKHIKEKGIDKILMLMEYTRENFDKITDIEYCYENRRMLEAYFERKRRENEQD